MASFDFAELGGVLSSDLVARNVTTGITPPPLGGGGFVYGMHAAAGAAGVVGLYTNQANFAPTPDGKGAVVSAAMKRSSAAVSPFLFVSAQTADVGAAAYAAGIDSAGRIVLRKMSSLDLGFDVVGAPDPFANQVLGRSSLIVAPGAWVHVQLTVWTNRNRDVGCRVHVSDLAANPVDAPLWVEIEGLPKFVEDGLSIRCGSASLKQGFMGFAAAFSGAGVAAFDGWSAARQA